MNSAFRITFFFVILFSLLVTTPTFVFAETKTATANQTSHTSHKYRVLPGDMIGRLARRFSVPEKALLLANNIKDPRRLRAWSWIDVPIAGSGSAATETNQGEMVALSALGSYATNPSSYRKYRLALHDNLSALSRKFAVSQLELAVANKLDDPNRLIAGMTLLIPEGGRFVKADATNHLQLAKREVVPPEKVKAVPVAKPEKRAKPETVASKPSTDVAVQPRNSVKKPKVSAIADEKKVELPPVKEVAAPIAIETAVKENTNQASPVPVTADTVKGTVETHLQQADEFNKKEKYDLAIEELNKAVKIAPDNPKTHHLLALAYDRNGEQDNAITEFKETIHKDPNFSAAYYNLGTIYAARRQYSDAIVYLKNAIRLSPNLGAAHSNLANAFLSSGDIPGAVASYKEFIRIERDNPESQEKIAAVKRIMQELETPPAKPANTQGM